MQTAKCFKCKVAMDGCSTQIDSCEPMQDWSRTCYVSGKHNVPVGCTFRVELGKKCTSKVGNKYWKANAVTVVVDAACVEAILKQHLWTAKTVMSAFDTLVGSVHPEVKSGPEYVKLWMEFIANAIAEGVVKKKRVVRALETLRLSLVHHCEKRFELEFRDELAKLGISKESVNGIAHSLEGGGKAVDPRALARQWLARPYSPYLGSSLSLKDRDAVASGTRIPERERYIAHTVIREFEMKGNTYMAGDSFLAELKKRGLGVEDVTHLRDDDEYAPLPKSTVAHVRDPTLVFHHLVNGSVRVQHRDVHRAEASVAKHLAGLQETVGEVPAGLDESGMNPEQLRALRIAFVKPLVAITGGPGRGKSWLCRKLCAEWAKHRRGPILVTSAYHQPLKNLREEMKKADMAMPDRGFSTVASCWCRRASPLCSGVCDERHGKPLVIVEEAGVLTILDMYHLLYRVLRTATEDCKLMPEPTIVLLGDVNQLRPIGPGQPFGDVIEMLPDLTVVLERNMRTTAPNVNSNLQSILGKDPMLATGDDFEVKPVRRMCDAVAKDPESLWKTHFADFNIRKDVAIVHQNRVRHALNAYLHNRHLFSLVASNSFRNRVRESKGNASIRFVRGTRVICWKTTPCRGLTNGTRGVVSKLSDSGNLVVMCEDRQKRCFPSEYWQLAYAITAHKAQGSEYDTPYVYFESQRVDRHWVYTAVSRAKKKVVYLVDKERHARAVARKSEKPLCMLPELWKHFGRS